VGQILIGTCSWTDPTLIESKKFYPPSAKSAEDKLRFYSHQFSIVEVDSSYYAMLSEKTCRLWVERTPNQFTFNVKAFRLFTQHPTSMLALPTDIRKMLPPIMSEKKNFYMRDIPRDITAELWKRFESALLPLDSAGKLGVVLLQFPPWFNPASEHLEYILACKNRLPQYRTAVEFRNALWLSEANRQKTLDFLEANELPFVCVDEPQGFRSSVPPLAEATSDIAVVRFHGRNTGAWEAPSQKASDRFNYYYTEEELGERVPRIKGLSEKAQYVHVLFNTNYQDQGIVNARTIASMLEVKTILREQMPLEWTEKAG
jgi:uncharacterized protein YecE (DUF72 family)